MALPSAAAFAPPASTLVCFTDGDRQFKVADLGRLLDRMARPDKPDVVVGYRIKRADPAIRLAYARAYRLALRIFYRLGVRDVDCACKLFRRHHLRECDSSRAARSCRPSC
jgi:dolichol-phosphate mannosyltransferase